MPGFFLYTLFYLLIAACIVYPPTEFVTAGLTISDIFSCLLGGEEKSFVQYHIRRSVVTLFVYSVLPFGYGCGLTLVEDKNIFDDPTVLLIFILSSAIIPAYTLYLIWDWGRDDWIKHPIIRNVLVYSNSVNNNSIPPWYMLVSEINEEYQRADKVIIPMSSISSVVVTDNWIIKILPYTIKIAHQSDAALIVNKTDTHEMSLGTGREIQFANIEVKSTRPGAEPFDIRLNVLNFKKLQDKISRPITVLQNIKFQKTLLDKFIEKFKEQVEENPKYVFTEELDQCLGCLQTWANVKLNRQCIVGPGTDTPEDCMLCYCRPMWCIDCMAKWFVSKQDEKTPETWFSSKCTCPVCRAQFCILDVCLIQSSYI